MKKKTTTATRRKTVLKTTGFGLIELKGQARRNLEHRFNLGGEVKPIRVWIEAEINSVHGNYDGIGQEFTLNVKKIKQVA